LLPPETIAQALHNTEPSASPSLKTKNLSIMTNAVNIAGTSVEKTDNEDLKLRDTALWECVSKRKEAEGYIYRYKLKDIFDPINYPSGSDAYSIAISNMNTHHFPALEGSFVLEIGEHRKKFGERKFMPWASQRVKYVVKELGYKLEYSSDGVFTEYPDKAVIESRWKSIMDSHPGWNLKMLTIKSSENTAGDREFKDAFCEYDALLSIGREGVHDQQTHVLAIIEFMVNYPREYIELKQRLVNGIKELTRKIDMARDWLTAELRKDHLSDEDRTYLARLEKNLERADVLPAIYADNFFSISWPENEDNLNFVLEDILESPPAICFGSLKIFIKEYSGYLARRFPDKEISMPWLCDELVKILDTIGKK
jgi:hypothetical protein